SHVCVKSGLSIVPLTGVAFCASTKTLATKSPAPPACGWLWQPAHELASGPESRVKRGPRSGSGVRGAMPPFVPGRPAPSQALKSVTNRRWPAATTCGNGMRSTSAWLRWTPSAGVSWMSGGHVRSSIAAARVARPTTAAAQSTGMVFMASGRRNRRAIGGCPRRRGSARWSGAACGVVQSCREAPPERRTAFTGASSRARPGRRRSGPARACGDSGAGARGPGRRPSKAARGPHRSSSGSPAGVPSRRRPSGRTPGRGRLDAHAGTRGRARARRSDERTREQHCRPPRTHVPSYPGQADRCQARPGAVRPRGTCELADSRARPLRYAAMSEATIDSVLREERVFPPPPGFSAAARIPDRATYDALYRRSIDDPEGFWAEMAAELRWAARWTLVLDWQPPFARWFVGGRLNVADNCLDRHLEGPRRNKAAL